jgi:replicative DNA helicase
MWLRCYNPPFDKILSAERTEKERLEELLAPTNGHQELTVPRGGERAVESFHFVEVGHTTADKETGAPVPAHISFAGQEGLGRGVLIELEQLEGFAAHYRSGVQRSHFLFNTGSYDELRELGAQNRLPLLGDFYAVFSARTSSEIVHAINQAIDLVERLKENYNVPYEAVTVYFAGADLEVHVDAAVFDIAPSSDLPAVYQRMSETLVGIEHGDKPPAAFSQLDLGAYRWDYMSAIPGTQVTADREAYKIRITYATFKRLSYQRLNEFTQRRPDLPPREPHQTVSQRAREFFQGVSTSLKREAAGGDNDAIASIFYRIEEEGSEIATARQLGPTLLKRLFNENRHDIHTFSPHLDRALGGGMNPGDLYVVAGFPGSGTSTFALQLMNHVAEHHDAHCVFVGLQRGVEELFKRSLSSLGDIPVGEIDAKRQTPRALYDDVEFNKRIMSAYERYQQFADRIVILEGAAASDLNRLTQFLRERKEALKLEGEGSNVLLVVDSLQLMVAVMRAIYIRDGEATDIFGNIGEEDVRILAGRLKGIARELDVTVLATMEYYDSTKCLSDQGISASRSHLFFDTQFADTVMLLCRQGASLKTLCDSLRAQLQNTPLEAKVDELTRRIGEIEKKHQATEAFNTLNSEFAILDILKNRSGPVDKVAFAFHKNFSRFEPVEYQ